jgi:methionyl-tRNA formyltransferase
MKYFYLAHNPISLTCLKVLVKENYLPEFIVIHKGYEVEKLEKSFFKPIINFSKQNHIKIYRIKSINEIKSKVEKIDSGICVGFMEIIRKDFFDLPVNGIFNLHCGKLPEYRGRAPISRAIINGDKHITVTLHKIDEGVDSGDIYIEKKIKINFKDDINILYQKCSDIAPKLIIELLKNPDNKPIRIRKQNIKNKAFKKITPEERKINWNNDITGIRNKIRALTYPYPGAFMIFDNDSYTINKADIIKTAGKTKSQQGKILEVTAQYLKIKCKNGILKISGITDMTNKKIKLKNVFSENKILK